MQRKPRTGLAFALWVCLGASCGKDSTGPSSALSMAASLEIASTLMTEVLAIGFHVFGGAGTQAAGSSAEATSATINQTVPCAGGGTMSVQGTWVNNMNNQGTGTMAFSLRQRPTGCILTTTQGTFTLDGRPELAVSSEWTVAAWNLGVATLTFTGGFAWRGAGGSGQCSINLAYNYNF